MNLFISSKLLLLKQFNNSSGNSSSFKFIVFQIGKGGKTFGILLQYLTFILLF